MQPTPQTPCKPPTRLRRAFIRMAWVGWSFEAALQNPTRRTVLLTVINKINANKPNKHERN